MATVDNLDWPSKPGLTGATQKAQLCSTPGGLNNDGVFETTPEANPTVTAFYGDEVIATATVAVMKNGQTKATDSITFQTVRCP
ncbi:hypothetical protein BH18VER2_BH18VER2_05090 [soil metagenome]